MKGLGFDALFVFVSCLHSSFPIGILFRSMNRYSHLHVQDGVVGEGGV